MAVTALKFVSPSYLPRDRTLRLLRASASRSPHAGRNANFGHGMHNNESHVGKVTWDIFAEAGCRNFTFTFPANAGTTPNPRFGSEDFVEEARYSLAQLFNSHAQSPQPSLEIGHSKSGFLAIKKVEFVTNHPEFAHLIDGVFAINPVVSTGINSPWNPIHALQNWRLFSFVGTMFTSGLFQKMWSLGWARARYFALNDPGRDPAAVRRLFESFSFEPGATLWQAGAVWSPSHRMAMRLNFRRKIKVPIFILGNKLDHSNNYHSVRRFADFLKANHEDPELVHFELAPSDHHYFEGPHEERYSRMACDFLAEHLPKRTSIIV